MSISMGSFITCFLGITFLSGYLYIILYRLNHPFIYGAKVIFVGISIIFLRICIPVNFPFTYTIYSSKLLLPIAKIFYMPIASSSYRLFDILILCWLLIAVIKLGKLCIRIIHLNKYLNAYTITEGNQYSKLFASVKKYCPKSIRIAVIPHNISPAFSGILYPTIIFPEYSDCFSLEELDYICMHEINHYKNHDLWVKMLLEIISCIHWWNPLVYLMKRDYALTLELTNDYLLKKNHPNYNSIYYAELILKIAKLTECSSFNGSNELMPFVRKHNSDLDVRISFTLKSSKAKIKEKTQLIIHTIIIFAIMIFSLLFVIDFTTRTPTLVIENSYEINSSNTYFIHTPDGYEVYVNGNYVSTIINLPNDFKNYKIYEQGDIVK